MFVALCDDEKSMLNHLTILLQEYGSKKGVEIIIDKFENGYDLLKSFRKYEIVFMDYQLKDIDGIKTARKMREGNCDCTIIFVSAYPEAALDSFEVNTFRFLRKPVDKHKLFCALDDYMKSIDFDNLLILKTNDGTWKIKTSDIIYAEAQSKHTVIRTVNECLEVFVSTLRLLRTSFRQRNLYAVSALMLQALNIYEDTPTPKYFLITAKEL